MMKQDEFYLWLMRYKEFGSEKANNIVKRLEALSDKACLAGLCLDPVFVFETVTQFNRWKANIVRKLVLSASEKKDLELLGDFLEIYEITKMNYSAGKQSILLRYCESMKMSYSYKPVLLLAMISCLQEGKEMTRDYVVDYFISYYDKRKKDGLIIERENSILVNDEIDRTSIIKLLENNPIEVLKKAGILLYNNDKIMFSTEYYPAKEVRQSISDACEKRLVEYYSRLTPLPVEKSPFDDTVEAINAITNEDEKERCFSAFFNFCKKVNYPIPSKKANHRRMIHIHPDDERKVGKLVQESFELLSKTGYVFPETEYSKFFSKEWSKQTFGLFYALFKEYQDGVDIREQVVDYRGNGRYYRKVFTFGGRQVLVTSEWYRENRERFIEWFNSLIDG